MICFTGKYPFIVDPKRRINIPASAISELLREFTELKETDLIFHITRGQKAHGFRSTSLSGRSRT
jgi:DNA-binding transcriptional regulator/RsmH inhibitor MraZ